MEGFSESLDASTQPAVPDTPSVIVMILSENGYCALIPPPMITTSKSFADDVLS